MMTYKEEIGQRRLKELALPVGEGVAKISFNATTLGEYSLRRKPILVALSKREWILVPYTRANVEKYRGHCRLVHGKKCIRIEFPHNSGSIRSVLSKYESADLSAPLYAAKTDAIFSAGKGCRTRKKVTEKVRENGTVRLVTKTKRFGYTTIVCKGRPF